MAKVDSQSPNSILHASASPHAPLSASEEDDLFKAIIDAPLRPFSPSSFFIDEVVETKSSSEDGQSLTDGLDEKAVSSSSDCGPEEVSAKRRKLNEPYPSLSMTAAAIHQHIRSEHESFFRDVKFTDSNGIVLDSQNGKQWHIVELTFDDPSHQSSSSSSSSLSFEAEKASISVSVMSSCSPLRNAVLPLRKPPMNGFDIQGLVRHCEDEVKRIMNIEVEVDALCAQHPALSLSVSPSSSPKSDLVILDFCLNADPQLPPLSVMISPTYPFISPTVHFASTDFISANPLVVPIINNFEQSLQMLPNPYRLSTIVDTLVKIWLLHTRSLGQSREATRFLVR